MAVYGRVTLELKIMVSAVRFCPSAPLFLLQNKHFTLRSVCRYQVP